MVSNFLVEFIFIRKAQNQNLKEIKQVLLSSKCIVEQKIRSPSPTVKLGQLGCMSRSKTYLIQMLPKW